MRDTVINEYFEKLNALVDGNSELGKSINTYIESEKKYTRDTKKPFLSIVTRTQGKRPNMLTETIMGLTGQSDTDFELLIVGHNLDAERCDTVNQMIDELPEWLKNQTRYIPVNGGTRTTPLNEGFAAAKGEYIAILDDDDIVFDNWVAEFKALYNKAPGKILHTYAIYQDWETVDGDIPRAAHSPDKTYCKDFKLLNELNINVCPPVCLAFPAFAFHDLKIKFDETLTTNEDWDYLMRVAFVTGVINGAVTTCIYRNWLNAENSKMVHSKKEWDRNYDKITNKFYSAPIALDSDTVKQYISSFGRKHMLLGDCMHTAKLYYDCGNGFNESNYQIPSTDNSFDTLQFDLSDAKEITKIRIDPGEFGSVMLENINISVIFDDGSKKVIDNKQIFTNGYWCDGKLVFFKADPQMIFNLGGAVKINRVTAEFDFYENVPDMIVDKLVFSPRKFIGRCLRKAKNLIKRILRVIK